MSRISSTNPSDNYNIIGFVESTSESTIVEMVAISKKAG